MHDAGVRVALGTDSGTANVPMGWGTHHELELYVEAGLTPMEAIVAATATSASVTPPVGEAGVRDAGGGEDCGSCGAGCGSAGGYSEYAGD